MRSLKMLSIALYRFDSKINLWGIKWLEAYPTLFSFHSRRTDWKSVLRVALDEDPAVEYHPFEHQKADR